MTTAALKIKLEKSLEVFAIGIFLSTFLLFETVVLNVNKWIYCFLPSLFIFSAIGAGIVTRALVSFTRLKGKPIINEKDFEEKFTGSNGVNSMFWVIVVIIAILVYLFVYMTGINLMNIELGVISIIVFILDVAIICWGLYNVISQLSFVIFFISIIPTMYTRDDVETNFYHKLNAISDSNYDRIKNLNKLQKKYNDRILWLENHMNDEKKIEYKAKIQIYEICLRDISDILNELDV